MTDSFRRYLRAKRTVDDRALDRRLVGTLRERLAERAAATEGPLRVLEVGAGVGTMVARLIDWGVLPPGETRYVAVDRDAETLAGAEPFLREWAAGRSDAAVSGSADAAGGLVFEAGERAVTVEPVAADAAAYAAEHPGEADALIGMALLDVLGFDRLDPLLGALAPGGTYYFPITFDGGTRFRPAHPDDRAIERLYHRHMDEKPGGDSRAGGAALARLREADGSTLLGVAGSDWIVRPADGEGGYPGDEAVFLRHILDTVETAVGEVIAAEGGETNGVSAADLDAWLETRRGQVKSGALVYLTHQLDLVGRVDGDV
ncbi:hypothetical protein C463_10300 [Halorubrum californiense DSM 19288]|uniref:Class I SAM-dependent methyltransferase n=1 Tax=Halorubrum californiense DSM 19288 TaxID=1227465 RepID=M0E7M4_9EURY|nr:MULTISPECIES: hypothetical protein [Halorubrum]ELZ42988.1 hypothetical protein C463_10300 [Halorubrum californiense DSM 19288]TKX71270.1 hypothetical protein EXE40_07985 [Halorubrum sp. GN11GM_10-3_MGM]